MPIKHAFTSSVADSSSTTLVRPSNWNASHNAPYFIALNVVPASTSPFTWTNQPNLETEFLCSTSGTNPGLHRVKTDLTYVTEGRLVARVITAGSINSILGVGYSTDDTTFASLVTPSISAFSVSLASTGPVATAWTTLSTSALKDVYLRLSGALGDGVADPQLGSIVLQVR